QGADGHRPELDDAAAWGELRPLAGTLHRVLTGRERGAPESEELAALRSRLQAAEAKLERAAARPQPAPPAAVTPPPERAALEDLRRRREERDAREQKERAALRQRALTVGGEVTHDLEVGREAVEGAERSFVEATALLSGLREAERLAGELDAALAAEEPR